MEGNVLADMAEENNRNLCLRSWANASSAATADIEVFPHERDDIIEGYSDEKAYDFAVVFVPCVHGFGISKISYPEGENYLFRWGGQKFRDSSMAPRYFYEANEDSLGFPDEAVGSVSPWPALWRHIDPPPMDLRGVFYAKYPRKELFSKIVNFKTAELPRWKPKAIIGLRTVEEEDV